MSFFIKSLISFLRKNIVTILRIKLYFIFLLRITVGSRIINIRIVKIKIFR